MVWAWMLWYSDSVEHELCTGLDMDALAIEHECHDGLYMDALVIGRSRT